MSGQISMEVVRSVRSRTGAGVVDCRNALVETGGDEERAVALLQEQGKARAAKRADRDAGEGYLGQYVHTDGKKGGIVELRCETDFVARNENFRALARDLAMQVVAMAPENTDELLSQPFFRDQSKTVADHMAEIIAELGEHIVVGEFARLEI